MGSIKTIAVHTTQRTAKQQSGSQRNAIQRNATQHNYNTIQNIATQHNTPPHRLKKREQIYNYKNNVNKNAKKLLYLCLTKHRTHV